MKKLKRFLICFLSALCTMMFGGCGTELLLDGEGGNEPQTPNAMVGPFTVINDKNEKQEGSYESLYAAIDEVGINGVSSWAVEDKSGKRIFVRGQKNELHLYTRDGYYGVTKNTKEADDFISKNRHSYVVNGLGKSFQGQSVTRMNDNVTDKYGYEYDTGSYIYQFTAPGYIKISQIVYLSKVKMRLSQNENIPYNAYFFMNTNGLGGACDMGLASAHRHNGKVYLFSFGFGNGFSVHENLGTITEFSFNEKTQEYENADDIYLEYTMNEFGTYLCAKNLKTGVEMRCSELLANSQYKEVYGQTWQSRPILQATSFVPHIKLYGRNLWDPRCGGYLRNVEYSDIMVYKQGDTTPREFYPSSIDTSYGFAYADDCSSFYEKIIDGKRRVVHDIAYDGSINNNKER